MKTASGNGIVVIFNKHQHFKNSSDFEQISGPKKQIKISPSRRKDNARSHLEHIALPLRREVQVTSFHSTAAGKCHLKATQNSKVDLNGVERRETKKSLSN